MLKIFIAPIGVNTNHVKVWLAEESKGVKTLWLIHSKKDKKYDFPKIAKKLKRDLESAYTEQLEIKLKVIDSAFEIDSTMDAISEIIHKEEDAANAAPKPDPLVRSQFTLNITGGTNAIAGATMLSATWYGTKADYVSERQADDPNDKQCVVHLPVKSFAADRMKDNPLIILKMIDASNYQIENTPEGISKEDIDITKGSITRKKLLADIRKLGALGYFDSNKSKIDKEDMMSKLWVNYSEIISRPIVSDSITKKTLNKRSLETIAKALEKDGYIESIKDVEHYVYKNKFGKEKILVIDNEDDNEDDDKNEAHKITIQKKNDKYSIEIETSKGVEFIEWPLKTRIDGSQLRYVITPAGKRAAREALMFN